MPKFNLLTKTNVLIGGLGVVAGAGAVIVSNANEKSASKAVLESTMIVPPFKTQPVQILPPYIMQKSPGIMPGSPPIFYDVRTKERVPNPIDRPPTIIVRKYPAPKPQPAIASTQERWPLSPPPQPSAPPMPSPSSSSPSTQQRWPAPHAPAPMSPSTQHRRPAQHVPAPMPPSTQQRWPVPPPSYPPPPPPPPQSQAHLNNKIGNSRRTARSFNSLMINFADWGLKREESAALEKELNHLQNLLQQPNTDHGIFKFQLFIFLISISK